jgi:hypothetical protein
MWRPFGDSRASSVRGWSSPKRSRGARRSTVRQTRSRTSQSLDGPSGCASFVARCNPTSANATTGPSVGLAARRSKPFANRATPWRAEPNTGDRAYGPADAGPSAGGPTTAAAARRSRARRLRVHDRAARASKRHDKRSQHPPSCLPIDPRINLRIGDHVLATHGNRLFGSRGRERGDQYVRDVDLILLGRPFPFDDQVFPHPQGRHRPQQISRD